MDIVFSLKLNLKNWIAALFNRLNQKNWPIMKFIEKIGVDGTQYDYITTKTAIADLIEITEIKKGQKLTDNIL